MSLTSESVEGASLPLEGIDHIHGGDGLPLGVLSVGDGVPDDVLKENLKDSTGLLVDQAGHSGQERGSRVVHIRNSIGWIKITITGTFLCISTCD